VKLQLQVFHTAAVAAQPFPPGNGTEVSSECSAAGRSNLLARVLKRLRTEPVVADEQVINRTRDVNRYDVLRFMLHMPSNQTGTREATRSHHEHIE